MDAPEKIWKMMESYGVTRDVAQKCMRNNAIVGHVEAQRQVVTDTWKTNTAPTFIVGGSVVVAPSTEGVLEDAIEVALKGGR